MRILWCRVHILYSTKSTKPGDLGILCGTGDGKTVGVAGGWSARRIGRLDTFTRNNRKLAATFRTFTMAIDEARAEELKSAWPLLILSKLWQAEPYSAASPPEGA